MAWENERFEFIPSRSAFTMTQWTQQPLPEIVLSPSRFALFDCNIISNRCDWLCSLCQMGCVRRCTVYRASRILVYCVRRGDDSKLRYNHILTVSGREIRSLWGIFCTVRASGVFLERAWRRDLFTASQIGILINPLLSYSKRKIKWVWEDKEWEDQKEKNKVL